MIYRKKSSWKRTSSTIFPSSSIRLVVKAGIQKRLTEQPSKPRLSWQTACGHRRRRAREKRSFIPSITPVRLPVSPSRKSSRGSFLSTRPTAPCPECLGLGFRQTVDADLICPDKTKTLREGAIRVSGWNLDSSTQTQMYLNALSKHYGFSMDVPVKDLPADIYRMLMYGNGGEKIDLSYQTRSFSGSYKTSWEGFVVNLQRRYSQTSSDGVKYDIERYMRTAPCTVCGGKRLKKEALSVYLGGKNIWDLCEMSVDKLYEFVDNLSLTETEHMIADAIVKETKTVSDFCATWG